MRFGWVVLKHFCALCGMVGLYIGLMPGGMGVRLAAVFVGSLSGGGWWLSRQRLEAVVAVKAVPRVLEPLPMMPIGGPVEVGWVKMPVRRPAPVYVHSMEGWIRR